MVSDMDYTSPDATFAFDVNKSTLFRKDSRNYINILGINQLIHWKIYHYWIFF